MKGALPESLERPLPIRGGVPAIASAARNESGGGGGYAVHEEGRQDRNTIAGGRRRESFDILGGRARELEKKEK